MTAARVLNPVVLTEFCKIHASPSAAALMGRNLSCGGQQLNRIKRDLFGPVNPVETNKIFVEELEKHQEKAIKKWGFDFRAGTPLNANSQYIWERVTFPESAYTPEMYTLTRAAHLRPSSRIINNNANIQMPSAYDLLLDERAERENFTTSAAAAAALRLSSTLSTSSSTLSLSGSITDTDSCDDSQDDEATTTIFKVPAMILNAAGKTLQLRKRQPKITEYMKERKRLAQTPKKLNQTAKRMRISPTTNNNSNDSSSSCSSNNNSNNNNSKNAHVPQQQQQQHSIRTTFSIRKFQREN